MKGVINKNYKYILYALFFGVLNNSIEGINYYNTFETLRLVPSETQDQYSSHFLIRLVFYYFGTFIISTLYAIYELRNNTKIGLTKSNRNTIKTTNSIGSSGANTRNTSQIIFIHKGLRDYSKISFSHFLFIIFLWVLIEQIIEKYNRTLSHLDFWMFELIIISFLSAKMFKLEIYSHQKFVLVFNLIPIIFKILTIVISFKSNEDDESNNKYKDNDGKLKILYLVFWFLIPLSQFIYIPLITIKSYVYIKMKWLMDLKYVSAHKLLPLYGLFGTLLYSTICIISTFLECKVSKENNTNILDYICGFKNEKNQKLYFENYSLYFKISSKLDQILFEVLALILGIITFYFYKYFSIKIIQNLTPVHLILISPMYFFFFKLALIIYNIFYQIVKREGKFLDGSEMKYTKLKFFLDVSGDICSFIGFLIYLEIIELKIFKLNYNTRKNIIKRSQEDSLICDDFYNENIQEDEDDDEENDNNYNCTELI